jgi:hypothetical protein
MYRATLAASVLLVVPAIAQKTPLDPVQREMRVLQAKLRQLEGAGARVEFLLSRTRDSGSPVTNAVERLLAAEIGSLNGAANDTEAQMARAVKAKSTRRRRTALAALVRRGGDSFAFALHTAVQDRNPAIGRHLIRLVRRLGKATEALVVLLPGLRKGTFPARKATAAAIGRVGHRDGIGPLEEAKRRAERRAVCTCKKIHRPRAHVAVVTRVSFVRDFNVELA